MNYSPDYSMRRRNQDCGCRRPGGPGPGPGAGNPPRPGRPSRPVPPPRPGNPPHPGKEPDSCGCSNRREPHRPGRRIRPMAAPASAQTAPASAPAALASTSSSGSPDARQVGMAYVPWQTWQSIYEPSQALMVGTIFQELDYPWMVGGGCGSTCR